MAILDSRIIFEDLETDLLAEFVANDVPAAFCAAA